MDSSADRTPARLAVDHSNKRVEVELASGLVLASPLSGRAAEHDGEIGRTDYEPDRRGVTITFHWGDTAVLEVGPAEPDAPVVYMHFLSCAAGYANFLLAEKATSHDLRRAERRVTSGARICASPGELADLVEALR